MAKGIKVAPRKSAAKENSKGEAASAAPQSAPAPAPAISAPPPAPGAQPAMRVVAQYLKDLSFENPNAPSSLTTQGRQPEININVNVNAKNLTPNDFEVELQLDAKASVDGKILFAAEMVYAGIFRMENFPQQMLHPAVLVECPRILFPFARQILADATRNGGFAPLMLDPIDFVGMYQKRMQAAAQAPASGQA